VTTTTRKEHVVKPVGWIGRRIIGDVLVMDLTERPPGRKRGSFYRCLCTCGNIFTESRLTLIKAINVSCGCKGSNARTTKEYADWVRAVNKASGHQCQSCGYEGRDVIAHHIVPWNQSVEQRFLVANGQTLCKPCHRQYHTTYGYQGNCTAQTLSEFNTVRRAVNNGA
jgi:5-methylcytosine-specific restriction endonuclease McrA